jgi:hypothetical protein
MPKTHELLELCRRGRRCKVGCVIDRTEVKAESRLEDLSEELDGVD